jgi:DNA-directed RNA polymerase specialized sigma24 family protein
MNIDGTYKVGNNKYIYLNSKTGEGFDKLIGLMRGFLNYQLSIMEFPSFGRDDLEQEMLALAMEALPRYDETKPANLLTFLQNHIKNRLINMCKFYSEKRRCATHVDSGLQKVRCNSCRTFFRAKNEVETLTCAKCGESADRHSGMWKFYNLIAIPGQIPVNDSDVPIEQEIDPDLSQFTAIGCAGGPITIDHNIDISRLLDNEDEVNKSIINLVCQGYGRAEIATKLNLTASIVSKNLTDVCNRLRNRITEDGNELSAIQDRSG